MPAVEDAGDNSSTLSVTDGNGTAHHCREGPDLVIKLLVIGDSTVGKTSFCVRYSDDKFLAGYVATVGIDYKVKNVLCQGEKVKVQIWDTAGQERYRTITTAYYRGAMGFVLMYDICNEQSFRAVADWASQISTHSWENTQVILVGNKCDLEDERIVSYEQGRKMAEQMGFPFFETSAKENINVRATFDKLVDMICDKISVAGPCKDQNGNSIQNGSAKLEGGDDKKGGCAC